MPHPSTAVKDSEDVLETLATSLLDNQESLRKVGETIKNVLLKEVFLAESLQRARFRGALETMLHQEGMQDIEESSSFGGALRRAWSEVKTALGGGDHALLETAEQAEDALIKDYAKALKSSLPFPVRQLLTTQYNDVQVNHDFVKNVLETPNKP